MKKSYLFVLLLILSGIASFQYWQIQKQAPVAAKKNGATCADFGSPKKRRECAKLTGTTLRSDAFENNIVWQNGHYIDTAILPSYRDSQGGDCSGITGNLNKYYKEGRDATYQPQGVQDNDPIPGGVHLENGKIVGSFCGVIQFDGSGNLNTRCWRKDTSGCNEEEQGSGASPSPTPSPSVSPSPSPSVSPSPSPSPTPTPTPHPDHAVLVIRKFKDDDRDGSWDANEGRTGIEWKFQYRINSDPWQDYMVPADRDYGGNVDISLGTKVEVREIEQGGWTNSTGLTKIEILHDARTYYFDFGNFQSPGVTVTPPPSSAPQAGTGSHFLPLAVLIGLGLALQLTAFLL